MRLMYSWMAMGTRESTPTPSAWVHRYGAYQLSQSTITSIDRSIYRERERERERKTCLVVVVHGRLIDVIVGLVEKLQFVDKVRQLVGTAGVLVPDLLHAHNVWLLLANLHARTEIVVVVHRLW